MKWEKKGLIYCASGESWWMQSHAMIPTPLSISENVLRIYCSFCDSQGIARVGYVDLEANEPKKILNVSKEPILDIGKPGCFDDNGVMVCSVLNKSNDLLLYYVGFEILKNIRYRLLTGLAINHSNSAVFERYKKTPILERSEEDLFFRCGPYVMYDDNKFKIWYVAGGEWLNINGKDMPVYRIKYMESDDGLNWDSKPILCIDMENEQEYGFGRPYVIKSDGLYKMFYSIRIKNKGYRLGYAESKDGIHWIRKDSELGLDVSESGWDSQMVCYSAVISINGKTYMFYNGNDYGRTGFGYAELIEW